jgi:hypothetical protein
MSSRIIDMRKALHTELQAVSTVVLCLQALSEAHIYLFCDWLYLL